MDEKQGVKMKIEPRLFPTAVLIATCLACGAELARLPWIGYHDYNNKRARLQKQIRRCGGCKTTFNVSRGTPTWQRAENGDLLAECLNGDFLIWRYGNAYKWRYRTYGKQYADQIGFARTKEDAKKACERHKEWRAE